METEINALETSVAGFIRDLRSFRASETEMERIEAEATRLAKLASTKSEQCRIVSALFALWTEWNAATEI